MKLTRRQLRKIIYETFISGPKGTINLDAQPYQRAKDIKNLSKFDLLGLDKMTDEEVNIYKDHIDDIQATGGEEERVQALELADSLFPNYDSNIEYEKNIRKDWEDKESLKGRQSSDTYAHMKGLQDSPTFEEDLRRDIRNVIQSWDGDDTRIYRFKEPDWREIASHIAEELSGTKKYDVAEPILDDHYFLPMIPLDMNPLDRVNLSQTIDDIAVEELKKYYGW